MVCVECGGIMDFSNEPLAETYKGEEIVVDGLEYHICTKCGEILMSDEMADKQAREMAQTYAKRHAIMPPNEIASLRKRLGLTQKQFEKMLGVSSPTVCRWERGSVQQSEIANNLMMVIRDVPAAANHLMGLKRVASKQMASSSGTAQFTVISGGKSTVPNSITTSTISYRRKEM